MLPKDIDIAVGVIEATKRPLWSDADRLPFMERLASEGLGFYILSTRPPVSGGPDLISLNSIGNAALRKIAKHARQLKLSLGLSVFPREDLAKSRYELKQATDSLLRSPSLRFANILVLRFDGSPRSGRYRMVDEQIEITETLHKALGPDVQIAVCPTLYADDVSDLGVSNTERNKYRQRLSGLPDDISIFWSGGSMMSSGISQTSIGRVASQYRRSPFLWCNSMTNDGGGYEEQLRLIPELEGVRDAVSSIDAIALNPMRQLRLSEIPMISVLRTLRCGSLDGAEAAREACQEALGAEVGEMVWAEAHNLDRTSPHWQRTRAKLLAGLRDDDSAYAIELRTWLDD